MKGLKMKALLIARKDGAWQVEMIGDDREFDEFKVKPGEEVNLVAFIKTKFIDQDSGEEEVVEH